MGRHRDFTSGRFPQRRGTGGGGAPPAPPGAPTGVSATGGDASATVSWTAPGTVGGGPITGYVITPYIGATPQAPMTVGLVTTALITGLTNGTTYTFRVAATNAYGTGAPSAVSNAVTPNPPLPSLTSAIWVCGAECGLDGISNFLSGVNRHIGTTAGTAPTIVTTAPMGMLSAKCWRFNATVNRSYMEPAIAPFATVPLVVSMDIAYATLPSNNTALFTDNNGFPGLYFNKADNTLRGGSGSTIIDSNPGVVIAAGTWYHVDLRIDKTGTTWTVDFRVNGTAGPQYQLTGQSASGTTGWRMGISASNDWNATGDVYIDNVIVSGDPAAYPLPSGGRVAGCYANADGVHGGSWAAGTFKKGAAGGVNAAITDTDIWSSLMNPLNKTQPPNYVGDAGTTALTDYVEFQIADAPALSRVLGAMFVVPGHLSAAGSSNFDLAIADGSGNQAGICDIVDNTTGMIQFCFTRNTDALGNPWTKAAFDALRVRFSSLDASPPVYLDGCCIELGYVP